MNVRAGTCGWSFDDWVGPFYPRGTRDQLEFYSTQFDAVEIDSTWYRVPAERTVRSWYSRTPEGFTFCPKMPGEVTHENLLLDSDDVVEPFLGNISHLREKLGPIVVQLAPKFTAHEIGTLEGFLRLLPTQFRYAVEFRHRSWLHQPDALSLLTTLNAAIVMTDHPWYPRFEQVTTDLAYVRLLGRRNVFPDFSRTHRQRDEALATWASLLQGLAEMPGEAFVFVNNQFEGHSPESVRRLLGLIDHQ